MVDTYIEISDIAQNAARLGAQQLVGFRSNTPHIDEPSGTRLMKEFVQSHGLSAMYDIDGTRAKVTIERKVPMRILDLIGISSRRVRVTRVVDIIDG